MLLSFNGLLQTLVYYFKKVLYSEKKVPSCNYDVCCTFEGPRYVLMNHHMLLPLKKSVMDHGPLWSCSLFVFEDWNGDIGNYFNGTQNIASQVSLWFCFLVFMTK